MASVTGRGFVTFADITAKPDALEPKVGGRVDYRHSFRDVNFTLSATDATAKDADSIPWLADAVLSADTKFRGAHRSKRSACGTPRIVETDSFLPAAAVPGSPCAARQEAGPLTIRMTAQDVAPCRVSQPQSG